MNQTVRPQNRREFMNKLVAPYDEKTGNPNSVFSETTKLGQPEINRAKQISVKGDTDKDFYVGIKDIDEALMYYFTDVLKLSTIQNNTLINVPILYGTPENWKGIQRDGFYRDTNGKILYPLLMFKRNNVTQNRGLGNKLDGNLVHNVQLFEKRYSKRNNYGNFGILTERSPETEYIVVVTPDYVTLEYDCIVWTYTVEQMDKIVESLNFASRSYWGDPNKFQFYSSIETFSDNISYDVGQDRAVKCTFTLVLNGYLIPDSVNKKIANANRYFGVSQVVFGLETAASAEQQQANMRIIQPKKISSVLAADSVNNIFISGIETATLIYLSTSLQVSGTYVNSTTATFNKSWGLTPTGLPANGIDNFNFFVNGQYIEASAITSWTDNGIGTSTLVINPSVLTFSFESTDLILAVGKFKP